MTRPSLRMVALAVTVTVAAASCSSDPTVDEIVLLTHDSFAVSEDVLAAFTAETGVTVSVLRGGDAGTMVSQAILTRDNPIADVMFGIDNTLLQRGLDAELFVAHESPGLATVPRDLQLDPEHRVTPIDVANVCVNYDKAALAAASLEPPTTLRDLTDRRYAGTLVVQDPATSSPGLAFLLSTIAEFPEGTDYTWREFWSDLAANDVLVTAGWEDAYFDSFTASGGDRPLVVSYASSPPVGVIFAEEELDEAPTGAVLDGCFRQIEFAGILAGTDATDEARSLIDFMLSPRFQEDIPLNMFVFPANADAALPAVFVEHTAYPERANILEPSAIEENRESWLETWASLVR